MGVGAAQQPLGEKQPRHYQEVPGRHSLGVRQVHDARLNEDHLVPRSVPAQPAVSSEEKEHHPGPAQQRHEAQCTPENSLPRRAVGDQRLLGPVVRVRIIRARAQRRTDPGGPREVAGQSTDLLWVRNGRPPKPLLPGGRSEPVDVVVRHYLPGMRLAGSVRDRIRFGIPGITFHLLLHSPPHGRRDFAPLRPRVEGHHRSGRFMEVLGREIGPQVGAVAEDRAMLHQAVLAKHVLPGLNIAPREDRLSGFVHDVGRHGRMLRVNLVGHQPQHGESHEEGENGGLGPPMRNDHVHALRIHNSLPLKRDVEDQPDRLNPDRVAASILGMPAPFAPLTRPAVQ